MRRLGLEPHRRLLNLASMLSYQGGFRVPSYTASEHGVMGLTRLMDYQLGTTIPVDGGWLSR